MSSVHRVAIPVGTTEITLETGKLAKQAGGSILISCGESMVLVTACAGKHRPDAYFFPLVVDYVEKHYAGGKIPGSFFRREGRPGELELLIARLTDRPIRPLFPDGYKGDTQIIATVISHDMQHDTEVMCITGASAALMLSSAPFAGPIAGLRIGSVNGKLIANPTADEREISDLDLVMACSADAIVMVEAEANEFTEEQMLEALEFGFDAAQPLIEAQLELAAVAGKENMVFVKEDLDPAIVKAVEKLGSDKLAEALSIPVKLDRYAAADAVKAEVKAALKDEFPDRGDEISEAFGEMKSNIARGWALKEGRRIDGRGFREIRDIDCEAGLLPRAHGSSLFTRGETQALVAATLGTSRDSQMIDKVTGVRDLNFMLHYNFPPFSVGEVKPLRSTGRREIGHGWLAHKALSPVVPKIEDFPYVLRVVSEVLESNGSSSMATVCGTSLALMDAGVPIKAPVAGIAMGMISEGDDYVILSDILGDEDHLGDMDFKVAGTADGITALQMDIKIAGLSMDIMAEAMEQAREGRLHILGKMNQALDAPREEMSDYAPRITTISISPDRIRDVIGAGGKTIRAISEKTNCRVEVSDDGTVKISSSDQTKTKEAIAIIEAITADAQVGEIYLGTVARVTDFGCFVTIMPGVDGLCHVSELAENRVDNVEDVAREGDEMIVKCIGTERGGKIRLSRKAALGKRPTVIASKLEI